MLHGRSDYLSALSTPLILWLLTIPVIVSAQASTLIPSSGRLGTCNFRTGTIHADCIPEYIGYLIEILFMLIGAFFFIMILLSGYQIAIGSLAGGEGLSAGLQRLKWAILGFMISAFSFFIIAFFISALGRGV